MNQKTIDLVAVLQGALSEADFAQRHGLTEAEAAVAREHFLAGMANAAAARPRAFRSTLVVVAAVALVGTLAARTAWAGSCATPGSFPAALGLTYFCPDDPAVASEMNGNTERLVTLITQKVGALPSGDVSTGTLTANTVSANTHTPRTGSVITNNGALTVTGQLDVGAYQKTCPPGGALAGTCFCNSVGERALSWSTTCSGIGHAVYSALFTADAQQRSGFTLNCYNVGNGNVLPPTSMTILCARLTVN